MNFRCIWLSTLKVNCILHSWHMIAPPELHRIAQKSTLLSRLTSKGQNQLNPYIFMNFRKHENNQQQPGGEDPQGRVVHCQCTRRDHPRTPWQARARLPSPLDGHSYDQSQEGDGREMVWRKEGARCSAYRLQSHREHDQGWVGLFQQVEKVQQ